MPVTPILFLVAVLLLAVAGYRDLKLLFAAQVGALAINLVLPVSAFGVTVTSQRLVTLAALAACALLFLQGRLSLPRPSPGQAAFLAAYGAFGVIHALHELRSPGTPLHPGMLSALFHVVLFYLSVTLLHNLDHRELRDLFSLWLPAILCAVMVILVGAWLVDVLGRPSIGLADFQQGYRLRNTGPRGIVNVFAASLVLVLPFAWRPLFTGGGRWRRVLSLAAVGAVALAIVLTFSRAALLGLVILFATALVLASSSWIWRPSANRRQMLPRALAALTGLVALIAAGAYALDRAGLPVAGWLLVRVKPILTGTDPSLLARLDRIDRARQLLDGLPVLGYGPGTEALQPLPENTLIFVTLVYGPLALACLLGMLALVGWTVAAAWWAHRERPAAAAWPAAFVAYLLLLTSNDFLFLSMGTTLLATLTTLGTARSGPAGARRPPEAPA